MKKLLILFSALLLQAVAVSVFAQRVDRLYIPYKGYETVDVPIDKRFFELKMKENGIMPLVDILDGSPDDPRLTPLLEAAESVDTMTQKYRFPVSP